jgi:tetratricopeptide (TPR) repeat protein
MKTIRFIIALTLVSQFVFGQSAINKQAEELIEDKNVAELRKLLSTADKKAVETKYYTARLAMLEKKFSNASDNLEEIVEAKPNVVEYHYWLGMAYGQEALVANFFKQGILAPKAKEQFEQTIALDPKHIEAMKGLVQFYMEAPSVMGGSIPKALEFGNKIKALDKVAGLLQIAAVYMEDDNKELAEKHFIEAYRTNSADFQAAQGLGSFYLKTKQFTKAFTIYDEFIKKNPKDLLAPYNYGKVASIAGVNLAKGEEYILNYIRNYKPNLNGPSQAGAMVRLGMLYEKKGSAEDAKKYYQAALKLEPSLKEAKEGMSRVS